MDITISDDLLFIESIVVSNLTTVPYYGSLIEANNYFATMLEGKKWNTYSPDDRNLALNSATRKIENLNFVGRKTDPNQQLEFPRSGDTVVPAQIKEACFEIAYSLLRGIDLETERANLFASTRAYGVITTVNRAPESVQPWIVAGIPSSYAWDLLLPFLNPRVGLSLARV